VAEKPSTAKALVSFLSNNTARTREGKCKYCKNFDFQYKFRGRDCAFTMTSVLGHLSEIDFPERYAKWHSVAPEALFEAPLVSKTEGANRDVEANLMHEARRCDEVVIWTDCDREGEKIGAEIGEACQRANARIRVSRAWFSSITAENAHQAMMNLRELDIRLVQAVDARLEIDLRLGCVFTRAQTLRLTPLFEEIQGKVLSYGPCQFPTLGFIVDRFLRVQRFVAEAFWTISVLATVDDGSAQFAWHRGQLFDRLCCMILYEQCVASRVARVASVVSKPTSKW